MSKYVELFLAKSALCSRLNNEIGKYCKTNCSTENPNFNMNSNTFKISSTDTELKTTEHSAINNATGKYTVQ